MSGANARFVLALAVVPLAILTLSTIGFVSSLGRHVELSSSSVSIDYFSQKVQPLFNQRCVVCHSCNIAPCQLNLTNYDGVTRGATKEILYNPLRLHSIAPTRFGIDATATKDWRARGFFSVLAAPGPSPLDSILLPLVKLRMEHPERLPKQKVEESLSCPANAKDLAEFQTTRPEAGMPYGLPALSSAEAGVLEEWMRQGAPGPTSSETSRVPTSFHDVENYLNGGDAKSKLIARYLFEHLFIAHLHLEGSPHARFFRLLRSSNACDAQGGPVELATRRPYGSPGRGRFWYCLKPIDQTIVDKNHVVYELGPARLKRWQELFNSGEWNVTRTASYEESQASNPFLTFQEIPARARYQWLLDDAQYTVMTFIKGPVCRGQTAVNVINEQFNVLFLDPKSDHFVNNAAYAAQVTPLLRLPGESGSDVKPSKKSAGHLAQLLALRNQYREARDTQMRLDRPHGYSLNDIWNGDQTNDNALLTVLRHYDSAQVVRGSVGPIPKTSFVLDYPLFERIVYDLVDGFDVFGNFTHQIDTREYMSFIRAEAEENYLNFLPPTVRRPLRDFYNRGWAVGLGLFFMPNSEMFHTALHEIDIPYQGDFSHGANPKTWLEAKRQFLNLLFSQRLTAQVRGHVDVFNRLTPSASTSIPEQITTLSAFEETLANFAGREAREIPFPKFLDDTMILRVIVDGGANDAVYTLVRNREHKNVILAKTEDHYRVKEEDVMVVSKGVITSYPNRFLVVTLADTPRFLKMLTGMRNETQHGAFLQAFAIARGNSDFWQNSDWFQNQYLQSEPINGGLLDLTRYESSPSEDSDR